MSGVVLMTPAQREAIVQAALRAYPNECCGLLAGLAEGEDWRVVAIHETANLSPRPERGFLVDPAAQFALLRALRGTSHRLIGCFHSHPDGRENPSESDRALAYESDFLYLIAAGSPDAGFRLNAFCYREESGGFIKLSLAE